MKWKKSLMVILVFFMGMMVNTEYSFASVSDKDPAVPDQGKVSLLYEGNQQSASHNYYRLAVKYSAESGNLLTVPKSLVIYETNLNPKEGDEKGEVEVHRATFGSSAGKPLKSIGAQSFLQNFDAFYYRNFTVKYNPKGTYKYRAVVTWVNSSGKEFIRTAEKEVTVTKEVSTQVFTVGNDNMFSRGPALAGFDKNSPFVPQKKGAQPGYDATVDLRENNNMDRGWGAITGETTLTVSVPDSQVFIANASLETHVVYTGAQLAPGTKVKVYIQNPSAIDNSLEVGAKREIPALSEHLTQLATAPQAHGIYTEGIYPKKHIEVYMGMGSGPQGDAAPGDNPNDVSFIFGNTTGSIHNNFEMHVLNEAGTATVQGFVFDFIKVTYNPIIFTSGIKIQEDGFVKPEGFLMLNSKFELENLPPSIPDNKIPDTRIRMYLQHVLNGELNDYTHFLNSDPTRTPFDGSAIDLSIEGTKINKCIKPTCDHAANKFDCDADTYAYDPIKKEITIRSIGEVVPKKNYNVKMVIPTKRKLTGKNVQKYNDEIVGRPGDVGYPGKTYPIKMEIIENNPLLNDSTDQLVRYAVNYTIKPYQMPGVN